MRSCRCVSNVPLRVESCKPFNVAVHLPSQSTRFFFSLLHSGRNFHSALLTADEVNGFITVLLKEYSQSSFYPLNKTFQHHPHSRMAVQYADEHPFP